MHVGKVTGCDAGHQEVGRCSTRGGSQGMCITFASANKQNKVEPTLALKPRETSPEIQNRGTSGPRKRTCIHQRPPNPGSAPCLCVDVYNILRF